MAAALSPAGTPQRPARRPRRRRRLLFAAVAVLLALLLVAALLETATRLLWTLPPEMAMFQHEGLVTAVDDSFGLRPGYRGSFALDGRTTVQRVDSIGLRTGADGAELPPRAPGQLRVLCAGDSLVFGYGVECREALPARLGVELADRLGRQVVAANAGVPGYGARATARAIDRLAPLVEPDALVFGLYLGNDFLDDLRQTAVLGGLHFTGAMAEVMASSWRAQLALRSRFWLWLETWILTNRPQWSPLSRVPVETERWRLAQGLPGPPDLHRLEKGLFLDVRDPDHRWVPGAPAPVREVLDRLRAALTAARARAGARPLVLVVFPTLVHVDATRWRERLAAIGFEVADFEFGRMRRRVAELAETLDVAVVDLTDTFAGLADPTGVFLRDQGHLSVLGNRLAAAAIADRLLPLLR